MASTITQVEKLVGKRIRRREDPRLITGTATYVDDIQMPGMHYAAIVRSPHAAARIRSIDTKAAAETPSVAAIYTGKDTAKVGPVPCGASLPGLRVPHHYILATDRVYFVGHPVAVVVATDKYLARDAAEKIEIDWDVLPAVADPEKAIAAGAPPVHPEWPDNVAFNYHQEGGDVDKAFAEAEVVVKQRITSQRLIPVRHGDARRSGGMAGGGPPVEPLHVDAGAASGAHAGCRDAGPGRESHARDCAGGRRRLRQQAEHLRRRSADGLRGDADRQAREVDRIAPREFPDARFTGAGTWIISSSQPRKTARFWASS